MDRVEENMRMKEQLYQMRNEIQETQLRFLSLKKIESNKKGYLERMSKERAERDEIYMKAKEYQLKISDPSTCFVTLSQVVQEQEVRRRYQFPGRSHHDPKELPEEEGHQRGRTKEETVIIFYMTIFNRKSISRVPIAPFALLESILKITLQSESCENEKANKIIHICFRIRCYSTALSSRRSSRTKNDRTLFPKKRTHDDYLLPSTPK